MDEVEVLISVRRVSKAGRYRSAFDSCSRSVLINRGSPGAVVTYLETFHKHFELILELKILLRLRNLWYVSSWTYERGTKDKHTRSSCSFSHFCFCLASVDSGSSLFLGFGSSEGTGIDNVGSGIVIYGEDVEADGLW